MFTVTCNGRVFKVSESRKECSNYVSMQKRKIKGAGLTHDGAANTNPAYAATCSWAIRSYKTGDRKALMK